MPLNDTELAALERDLTEDAARDGDRAAFQASWEARLRAAQDLNRGPESPEERANRAARGPVRGWKARRDSGDSRAPLDGILRW